MKQLKGYDNAKLTQLGQEMQNLLQRILHQSTITVALTYSEADKRKIAPIYSFLNDYANSPVLPAAPRKSNGNRKEAFITSGNVNFVAKATNFKKLGYDYSGVFAVANQLLNNEYLWNRVRSEGGAYGGFSVLRRSGDMAMVSYRDPNISKTYDIFGDTAMYFKNLALEREQIKNTIIGTISNFDQPMTPSMENSKMLSMYLTGLTYQDQKITRKEILNTGLKDLQNMQFIYSDFAREDYLCALGTKKDIQNDAALFQTVLELNS